MSEITPLGRVEMVPIGSVRPAEGNPRKIPERAVQVVAESLRAFGWQQPIVVDAAGEVVAGHTRLRAAALLGEELVPVVRAEGLTPAQVRAYRIADNRTADFSSWDFPGLAKELEEIGDDYAAVLALDDWDVIMSSYEQITAATEAADARLKEISATYDIVVTFHSKDEALAAVDSMFALGAMDVRHKLG
jgi:hypothetical protein